MRNWHTWGIHCVVLLALLAVGQARAEDEEPLFGPGISQLYGRHPELADNIGFKSWVEEHGISSWNESNPIEDGPVTLVVVAAASNEVFAVKLKYPATDDSLDVPVGAEITRSAVLELTAPSQATYAFFSDRGESVLSAEPTVIFDDEPTVSWKIRTLEDNQIRSYFLNNDLLLNDDLTVVPPDIVDDLLPHSPIDETPITEGPDPAETPIESMSESSADLSLPLPAAPNEDLAENECHHPSQFKTQVLDWVGDASTTEKRAMRICTHIHNTMRYGNTVNGVYNFTWADTLIKDVLGMSGICDEFAVMQVSALRSIGIPAKIEYLIYKNAYGVREAHACVEWQDGDKWRHMDAEFGVFDNRAYYRQHEGWTDVKVMSARSPLDLRSAAASAGLADLQGDLKFSPYKDFILSPELPGNREAGYSF